MNNSTRTELKLAPQEDRCSAGHRFLFQWESGHDSRNLPLTKACLRVYLQPINRLLPVGRNASVNISISIMLTKNTGNANDNATTLETDWEPVATVEVAPGDGHWLELQIEQQLAEIWDYVETEDLIEVQLRMEAECDERSKLPARLVNPATAGVSEKKRENNLVVQPILVLSIDDEEVKRAIFDDLLVFDSKQVVIGGEEEGDEEEMEIEGVEEEEEEEEGEARVKRNARRRYQETLCKLENFTINFVELGFRSFLAPLEANIRRCVGQCSFHHIVTNLALATNHAKIIASASFVYGMSDLGVTPPKEPCCAVVSYSPIYIVQIYGETIEQRLYPNFVADKCGCQ